MSHSISGRPLWWLNIAWSLVVWIAVLAAALLDRVVADGLPDLYWIAVGLAAVFLIGVYRGDRRWASGALWVLVPLAAFLVWQIFVVFNKSPNQSPDLGVEIMIVVYGTPIILGLLALLIWVSARLGVFIGARH